MRKLLVLLLAFVFIQVTAAAPDEAIGRVITVLSGDSFGIEITNSDPRTQAIDRVKLADVEAPSTITPEGKSAKKYAASILKNKTVYLDIDDNSAGGRNDVGQLVCVVYLMDSDSRPVWPCFNRILVESGNAVVNDDKNNEFNTTAWWQKPPDMKVRKPIKANVGEEINRDEASILKRDPNSTRIDIGYRTPKAVSAVPILIAFIITSLP